jgi:hypothetical protein
MLLPSVFFRAIVDKIAPPLFAPGFYLNWDSIALNARITFLGAWLAFFMAYKVFWLFPISAILICLHERRYLDAGDYLIGIACGLATSLLASDTSRIICVGFPVVLLGALEVRKQLAKGPISFATLAWALIGLNLLVPQYYVGQSRPILFIPLPFAILLKYVFHIDVWADAFWI